MDRQVFVLMGRKGKILARMCAIATVCLFCVLFYWTQLQPSSSQFLKAPSSPLAYAKKTSRIASANNYVSHNHQGTNTNTTPRIHLLDTSHLDMKQGYVYLKQILSGKQLDYEPVVQFQIRDELLSDLEKEALESESAPRVSDQPSRLYSKFALVGRRRENTTSNGGEIITVRLDLRDQKARSVDSGGHQIQMWMKDRTGTRSAALHVIDMRNGSYVSSFPVLWAGETVVYAALVFSRDLAHVMTRLVLKLKFPNPLLGAFVRDRQEQTTLCSPFPVIPGYPVTCNLTSRNSGLDYFCGKPSKSNLTCADWRLTRCVLGWGLIPPSTLSEQEQELVAWNQKSYTTKQFRINHTVTFSTKAVQPSQPKTPCSERKPRDTWTDQSPQGFFLRSAWHNLECTLLPWKRESFAQCLRNTTIWFLGDSNTRMMFAEICNLFKGRQFIDSKKYKRFRLHVPQGCNINNLNFKTTWYPHELPFIIAQDWSEVSAKKSPRHYMNMVPKTGNYIILIHLYAHFSNFPSAVFTQHVRDAVKGVRDLLQRNPSAKVVVRGPHCWQNIFWGDGLAAYTSRILKQEFEDLKDRVFYMDLWGMSLAGSTACIVHPPDSVVREMTRQFLSLTCGPARDGTSV